MSIQIVKEPHSGMHILLFTGRMESEIIEVCITASELSSYKDSI